jgi:hypothetical protein
VQAVASAVNHLGTDTPEDFSRWFCSELVAAGLEYGGALPPINCSEVTPIDLCRFAIYADAYYQLSGRPTAIRGYNSIIVERWIS